MLKLIGILWTSTVLSMEKFSLVVDVVVSFTLSFTRANVISGEIAHLMKHTSLTAELCRKIAKELDVSTARDLLVDLMTF